MLTKEQEVIRVAQDLYRQRPDWLTFFREILGVDGVVRRVYPDSESYSAFERTEEYQSIQQMVQQLRAGGGAKAPEEEAELTTVITVRLPKSVHSQLKQEAHEAKTSMNRLCILKLLKGLQSGETP